MRRSTLSLLRCPACKQTLDLEDEGAAAGVTGRLVCACQETFAVRDGIPDLIYPRAQSFVHEDAGSYDDLIDWIARLLNEDVGDTRARAAELLEISSGARVLEVACGTGANFPFVLELVGMEGELHAFDIAPDMLRVARQKLADEPGNVELSLANGIHLPFADGSFDALLHIGTLNRFGDVRRALAEMARVVKVGGKVVAGDEGIAPWLLSTDYGRILEKFGALFKGHPPLAALPPTAQQVRIQWLFGNAYYLIDFRVGRRERQLNIDIPLPGRRETVRDVLERKPRITE